MLDSIFVGVGPDGLLCRADGDNDLTSFYSTIGTTVVGRNVFFSRFFNNKSKNHFFYSKTGDDLFISS